MKPPSHLLVQHTPRLLAVRHSSAFTLLELLVAATVSMLLVCLLLMATRAISANYTHTQANITRQGDAAFALDQLIQDLEGYVVPNFAQGEALKVTPETVGAATNAIWLTLLSTATDADTSTPVDFTGATRAISYRMAFQNTIATNSPGTDPSFALYRSISSAKSTFTNVTSNTTNMQVQYWPTAPTATTDIGNFLAENVVGLSVRFLYLDSSGAEKWTSPGDQIRIGRDGSTVNGITIPASFLRAEATITVLSPEGAQRVKDGVLSLKEAVARYGKTSVRQTAFF